MFRISCNLITGMERWYLCILGTDPKRSLVTIVPNFARRGKIYLQLTHVTFQAFVFLVNNMWAVWRCIFYCYIYFSSLEGGEGQSQKEMFCHCKAWSSAKNKEPSIKTSLVHRTACELHWSGMLVYTHIRSLGSCNRIPRSQAVLSLLHLMIYSSLGFLRGVPGPIECYQPKAEYFFRLEMSLLIRNWQMGTCPRRVSCYKLNKDFHSPSSWMFPVKLNTIWGFGKINK